MLKEPEAVAGETDGSSLRRLAEERRAQGGPGEAAAWERIILGLDRLDAPFLGLLIVAADGQATSLPEGLNASSVALQDVCADPAVAVGASRILIALPPGRLLSLDEATQLHRMLGRRPAAVSRGFLARLAESPGYPPSHRI
jgi:hypothetical protein